MMDATKATLRDILVQARYGILRKGTLVFLILGLLLSTFYHVATASPSMRTDLSDILDLTKVGGLRTNGEWIYDVVLKGFPNNVPAMDLDSKGQPHVVFVTGNPPVMTYAWKNGTVWEYEILNASDVVTGMVAIALGPDDSPHIVYKNWLSDRIFYMHKQNGTWNSELAARSSGGYWVGLTLCIAVDSKNRPNVGEFEGDEAMFKEMFFRFLYRGPDGWGNSTRYLLGGTGARWSTYSAHFGCSVAIDSHDRPHIAAFSRWSVGYGYWDGAWHGYPLPEHYGFIPGHPWLALDSQDRPHVVYTLAMDPGHIAIDLIYATKGAGGWNIKWVETDPWGPSNSYNYMSIAVDSRDVPRIAYPNWERNLTIASYNGGWSYRTVDSTPETSPDYLMTIKIDKRDNIGILYVVKNKTTGDYELRYAYNRIHYFKAEKASIGDHGRPLDVDGGVSIQSQAPIVPREVGGNAELRHHRPRCSRCLVVDRASTRMMW